MCWDSEVPSDLVERIWRNPHSLLTDGDRFQDKMRCTVVRIGHPVGPFVWKHHNWGNLRRTVKRSLSQTPAQKSWADAIFLQAAGIPTPRPRAFLERRLGPFRICSYLLTDYIEGTSLYRLMRFGRTSPEFVRHLARQVAAIWQQLDDLRVVHNDFKPENLLVDPHGKVWLIDFERMRHVRRLSEVRRRQVRDAGDLLHPRNWRSNPALAEVFRREIAETPAAKAALTGRHAAVHPLGRPRPKENCPSQLVTVLIPCRNAAETITACLESVRDMADEIIVADAGSTDETLNLVRAFGGCRIVARRGPLDAMFEAWAHNHTQHPWILRILPNERLNPELSRKVQDVLATEPAEDGFLVPRTHYFWRHRLRHGGFHRQSSIRLYRKNAARYETRNGRVEVAIASDKTSRFKVPLFYHPCSDIQRYVRDMVRKAARSAEDAHRRGMRPKRRNILWHAPWQFVRSYVLQSGWLDGWAGLHASWSAAFSVCLREAMLWEMCQPTVEQRSIASDSRRELALFEPERITAPAAGIDASSDWDEGMRSAA